MSEAPLFSVIVPARQAEALLPETLGALAAAAWPGPRRELIVVDDGSSDGTAQTAGRWADRVVRLAAPSGGPARARNAGAAEASGTWLVFLDADVRVHHDTLARFAAALAAHPGAAAVFGTYDAHPAAPGLVSQYRNLLHRYVHLRGAGPAETFWAGCGAVRRDWFERVGGFDAARFPRPQVEDIELGYRLRDRGAEIVLDPAIEATHLKRWTLAAMLRTDVTDRGIPWLLLLLRRRHSQAPSLNVGGTEPLKVGLAGAALAALPLAIAAGNPPLLGAVGVAIGLLIGLNLDLWRWFARERGAGFAVAVVPLHLMHYAGNAVAAAVGTCRHALDVLRGGRKEAATPRDEPAS